MAVELIAKPHPLRSDTYICQVEPGTTLASVLEGAPETVYAQVNGKPWPRDLWDTPLPEGHVVVYAVPHGDDALRAVAMIAVAIAAAYTGGAALAAAQAAGWSTAAATAASVAASTAVTVAGTLAVNALIPPTLPETPESTSSTVRKSITGTRNQANPYGVVPRVYGAPRWYPPLAANPVTEVQGNDQYLRMLLCLGYGPLEVAGHRVGAGYPLLTHVEDVGDAIRIGETNISQYDDVEWEIGSPEQITLYTQDIVEEPVSVALDLQDRTTGGGRLDSADNVSAVRTTAPNTREISVDVTWPSGLYTVDSKGDAFNVDVHMRIEYRPLGGDWRTHFDGNVSAKRKETLRKSWRWTVLEGQYEVRVTRVSTYSQNREAHITDAVWTALRSVQGNSRPYTGQHVVMALRIRANDQLNGVIDQLNIKTQAVLRTWDGAAFYEQATSNPAWAYLDALTGKQVTRPVKDARVDLDAIRELADWCEAQGLAYHWVHDGPETVLERARAILAAGQASFALQDGRYSVVRDDPEAPVLQVITPRNASGFESSRQYRSLPHALRVKYIDPATWTDAERIVYREGYSADNATIFEDLQLQGVASAEEAYHHGQYHFRQAILRPETYSVTLDWENLVLLRGNRARLAYDTIMVGLGWGRVRYVEPDEAGAAQVLVLDETVILDPEKQYGVRIRHQDGTQTTVAINPDVMGYAERLTLSEPVEGVEPGDLVLVGELGRESIDVKVTRIEPGADLSATLTLVDAAPDIYEFDSAPSFDPGITRPPRLEDMAPPRPMVTRIRGDESALTRDTDGSLRLGVRIAYAFAVRVGVPALQVEARWRRVGEDWQHIGPFAASGELLIPDVELGDEIEAQVRALNNGRPSAWSETAAVTVTGKTNPPHEVEGFTASQNGANTVFRWQQVPDLDLQGYQLRYMSGNSPFRWDNARELTSTTRGTQVTSALLPPGIWYVGIKAVDTSGNESRAPNVISVQVVNERDAIYEEPQAPAWPGVLEGFAVEEGALVLPPEFEGQAVYTAPYIDMAFIDTVRAWAAVRARTESGADAEPRLELRYSTGLTDDDPMWTDDAALMWTNDLAPMWQSWSRWQRWTVGEVEAELVQFRLIRDSADGDITIREFTPTLDVPPRSEARSNVAVPAGGATILFDQQFHTPPVVQVTVTSGGAYAEPVANALGFDVTIYDIAGNPVAGTINWTASTE